jgi:TrmH family RNA methyltransferase
MAAVPRNGTPLPEADLTGPAAILLGGEGAGLPREVVADARARLTIPMEAPVESLNVAIAASLILYEAARQRHN